MTSDQLIVIESISRAHPDRVVRLLGSVSTAMLIGVEPLELIIYRGFSSCITHPTAFDPDRSVLPEGAVIDRAFLLQGPLNPACEEVLAGPVTPDALSDLSLWR